jgi:hypothetical protein
MSSEELGPAAGPALLPRSHYRGVPINEVCGIRPVDDPAPAAA